MVNSLMQCRQSYCAWIHQYLCKNVSRLICVTGFDYLLLSLMYCIHNGEWEQVYQIDRFKFVGNTWSLALTVNICMYSSIEDLWKMVCDMECSAQGMQASFPCSLSPLQSLWICRCLIDSSVSYRLIRLVCGLFWWSTLNTLSRSFSKAICICLH